MKKLTPTLLLAVLALTLSACTGDETNPQREQPTAETIGVTTAFTRGENTPRTEPTATETPNSNDLPQWRIDMGLYDPPTNWLEGLDKFHELSRELNNRDIALTEWQAWAGIEREEAWRSLYASRFIGRFDCMIEGRWGEIFDKFVEYLEWSEDDFVRNVNTAFDINPADWEGADSEWYFRNGILETQNLFSFMVKFDIPDEVVLEAIKSNNARCYLSLKNVNEYFTEKDIEVLLSRDAALAAEWFSLRTAIVVEDRVIPPNWLYRTSSADWAAEGITLEQIESVSDVLRGIFDNEQVAAFESELSVFAAITTS